MIIIMLVSAGFLAGMLNALAGGGTFLTFPALMAAGVPAIEANATSTAAVLPGYISSAIGFRKDVAPVQRVGVAWLVVISLVGGLLGAGLLLVTPEKLFERVVPWLLLTATVLFAFGPQLARRLRKHATTGTASVVVTLLAVSIYGGYFNGGVGILLLAVFSLLGLSNLNAMNGLKTLISAVLSVVSVAAFAIAGVVEWPEGLAMMAAATAGGYGGAWLARRLPQRHVRLFIIAVGVLMSAIFFLQDFGLIAAAWAS